jgi:hypothetical protein
MFKSVFRVPFAGAILIGLGLFLVAETRFALLGSACNILGIGVLLFGSGAKRRGTYILLVSLAVFVFGVYFETDLLG